MITVAVKVVHDLNCLHPLEIFNPVIIHLVFDAGYFSLLVFSGKLIVRAHSEEFILEMTSAVESKIHRTPFDSCLNSTNKDVIGKFVESLHLYLAKEVKIRH